MSSDSRLPGLGHPAHVVIVDDESFVRSSFQLYFETLGYRVSAADGGEAALAIFEDPSKAVDVVLLDLVMPGMHGIEVLRRMKEINSSVEIIIATGCGNMNSAVEALRYGAYDYITKPIVDFDQDLLKVVREAVAAREAKLLALEGERLKPKGVPPGGVTSNDVKILRDLESLAEKVIPDKESLKALGTFLEDQMNAVAAIAFESQGGQAFTCLKCWGRFAQYPTRELALAEATAILKSIPAPGEWHAVPQEKLLPANVLAGGKVEHLDALHLPLQLSYAVGRARTGELIVLRSSHPAESQTIPAPHLLSLISGRILQAALDSHPVM